MHQLGQARHEHWSGQGVFEPVCVETQNCESNTAADPFSKLLARFESQELLPSLHPSSSLTPSKRQRKSYRPLRVPPTHEMLLPLRDKECETLGIQGCGMDQSGLVEQHPPAFLQVYDRRTHSNTQEAKKLEPSLMTRNGFQMPELPKNRNGILLPTSLNPEKSATNQVNGWKIKSSLPTDKLSNGLEKNGFDSSTYSPNLHQNDNNSDSICSTVCRNIACNAQLPLEASFCRRCSCCICKLFDDKKDPSLWILCDPIANGGCGLSCHIDFALKQQVAGVAEASNGSTYSLDGSYVCQSCGAITSLIGCWKEQLFAAKESWTFDKLRYRLLLSYRLLKGTTQYKDAHGPIEEALKKLDAELSQLATGSLQRLRCNKTMLSCKDEVLRLITLALERADIQTLASRENTTKPGHSKAPCMVYFEDVSSSSIVVSVNGVESLVKPRVLGYKLWHRRTSESTYACNPTSVLYNINDKFVVSNLHPLTDYTFKVVLFCMEGDVAMCEAGCSTKRAEPIESPMDVYASLDVVLINTKLVGEGTSRCINQVFNSDHHIDKPKNGLKIQDLEEASPGQKEQMHHVSSISPSLVEDQKEKRVCFEGLSLKNGATGRHGKGENHELATITPAQLCRKIGASASPRPSNFCRAIGGSGNMIMRKSPCESINGQEDEHTECQCGMSEVKTTCEREFCCDVTANGFCSFSEKASTTKLLKCDLPTQAWGVQAHNAVASTTQPDTEIVHGSVKGVFAFNGEIEFSNYEFSVKVIRWLECEGHLNEEFRMKFLTWYTLRASEHEKRVVSVFIDTLQDDPASLGGQLMDAFEDIIETKRQATTPDGYCRKLW